MASCPNKNHPDWIALEDKVGVYRAFDLFHKNGERIPSIRKDLNLSWESEMGYADSILPEENSELRKAYDNPELMAAHKVTQKPMGTPFGGQTEGVGLCDGTCNIMAHRLKEANLPVGTVHISDKYANYHAVALTRLDGKIYILNQPQLEFIGREYQKAPLWEQIEYWRNMDERFNRHMPQDLNTLKYAMGLENNAYESFFNTTHTEYGDFGPFFKDVIKVGEGLIHHDPALPGKEVDIYEATSVEDSEVKIKFKVRKGTSYKDGFDATSVESTKRDERIPVWTSQELKPRFIEATEENLRSEYQLTEEQVTYSMEQILKASIVIPNKTEKGITQGEVFDIEKKLDRYNKKLNTSHKLNFTHVGPEWFYSIDEDFSLSEPPPAQLDLFESPVFQLSATEDASIEALNNSMKEFLRAINVSYESVNMIRDRNGRPISAVAKANLVKKVVEVVEGKMDAHTLPEEAAHFMVAILKEMESPLYDSMRKEITEYQTYADVQEEYNEVYDNDSEKIIDEAIGKLISKIIVAKTTGNEVPQKVSRFKRWFDKVLAYLRKIMGRPLSNPFTKAALDIMDKNVEGLKVKMDLKGELFQLGNAEDINASNVEDTLSLFKAANERFEVRPVKFEDVQDKLAYGEVLEADDDGFIMRYWDKVDNSWVYNRVTDKNAKIYARKLGKKRGKSINRAHENKIKRDGGTKLHDTMQEIVEYKQNKKGTRADIFRKSGLTEPMFKKLEKVIDDIVSHSTKHQMAIDTAGTFTVIAEQKIHEPDGKRGLIAADTVGTVDLIVLYSDNTADVYDYKFISPKGGYSNYTIGYGRNLNIVQNPHGVKLESYTSQMASYKHTLTSQYGIKEINRSRMVTVHVQYGKSKVGGKNILTDKIVKLETDADNKFLGHVPVAAEKFGDKGIDALISKLTKRRRNLERSKEGAKDIAKRDEIRHSVRVLDDAIRTLQLGGGINTLFYDARIKMTLIDKKLGLAKDNPDYMTDPELREMLNTFELLGGMVNHFSTFFASVKQVDPAGYKKMHALFTTYQSSIMLALRHLKNERDQRILEIGIENDIENNTRVSKSPGRWDMFKGASESQNPIFQTAWKIIEKSQHNARINYKNFLGELTEKEEALKSSPGFKSLQSSFDLLYDNETGGLIHKYSADLYDAAAEAREQGNIKWIKENYEVDPERYKGFKERKDLAFKRINELNADVTATIEGVVKIEENREKTRARLKKSWLAANDFSETDAWIGPYAKWFLRLKPEKENLYLSDRFKEIKDNKALVDYYEFYQGTNRQLAQLTGHRVNQSHVANIRQSAVEALRLGNFKGTFGTSLDSLKIKENDPTHGTRDPVTGESLPTIPLLYLDRLVDADGKVTNENKTRDLSTALSLMVDTAFTHAEREKAEDQIVLMHNYLLERGSALQDASGSTYLDENGVLAHSEKDAETAKNFEKLFLNRLIYGQSIQGKDKNVGGYSLTRGVLQGIQFYSAKVLGFSGAPALAAHLAANIAMKVEGSKGIHYDRSMYREATWEQAKRDSTFIAVNNLFEIEADDKTYRQAREHSAGGKVAEVVSWDTLFVTYRLGDEVPERRMLAAMTKNYGVDAEGMPTRLSNLPEGSKSIFEMMRELGTKVKPGDEINVLEKLGISEKGYIWFRGAARAVARSAKGMPTSGDPSLASLSLGMRAVMQFKTWMPGILTERFGNLRYRPTTRTYEQGRYMVIASEALGHGTGILAVIQNSAVTGMKLLADAATFGGLYKIEPNKEVAGKLLQQYKESNLEDPAIQKMTLTEFIDMRKGQLRAGATELRAMLMVIAALLLLSMKGDDDREFYKKYWLTRKVYKSLNKSITELGFAINPKEFTSLTKNAVPAMGLLNDLMDVASNTLDESMDAITGRKDPNDTTGWFYHSSRFLPGTHGIFRTFEVTEADQKAAGKRKKKKN